MPIRRGLQSPDGFMRVLKVEAVIPAAMSEAIDLQKLIGQHIVQHHVAQAATTQANRLGLGQWREAKSHEHLQRRDLGLVFFRGIESHNFHSGCFVDLKNLTHGSSGQWPCVSRAGSRMATSSA